MIRWKLHKKQFQKKVNTLATCMMNNKRRKKLSPEDFEPIKVIGRGAFGEVRICKWKETGEIVAVKKMKKKEML